MPGKNAFAFTGSAFVPADRNQTALIQARPTASTFSGVKLAKDISGSTSIWDATPPVVTGLTVTFSRQGTFPNHSSAYNVTWSLPTQISLVSGFDVFVSVNNGAWTKLTSTSLSSTTTSYLHTGLAADTNYKYYVRSNSKTVPSLVNETAATANSSIASPAAVTTLVDDSSAWNSITWKWTYTAGVYQRFYVYNTAGTYLGQVAATVSSTSSTWTSSSLSENTSYGLRVYGENINGHSSTNKDATKTTPYRCDCTGIIDNSTTTTTGLGCGTCGTRTSYKRSVCGDTLCYSSCTENACGCVGDGTNGWTYVANGGGSESAGCGTCGIQYRYKDKYTKSGCTDVLTDWKAYGSCDDAGDCVTYGAAPCTTHYTDVTESEFGNWSNVQFLGLKWSYVDYTSLEGEQPPARGLVYLNGSETRYEHFSECCSAGAIYGCNTNCGQYCCSCFPKFYRAYRCTRTQKLSFVFMRCVYTCIFGC